MKTQTKKRIKQVFRNSDECLKRFATQTQSYGIYKCKSRDGYRELTPVYFRDSKAFSYGGHYLLAKVGLTLNGVRFAMVNGFRYSNSTSGHQWTVARELEKQGYLLLWAASYENSHGGICHADEFTSDEKLVELCVKQLERDGADLATNFFRMTFQPFNTWYINDLLKTAKAHNDLCLKLKLKNCMVKIPDRETLKQARQLYNLHSKAKLDHASREQFRLFTPGARDYQTWRESRAVQRRTA